MEMAMQDQPIAATVAPAPSRMAVVLKAHVAALASGALLLLCYFPFDCGWFAWVALVPLLGLVRTRAGGGWVFLASWAAGLAFFLPVLNWMKAADERMVYTMAALAIYCSFYFPLAVLLVRRLDRRTGLPLIVTLPIVWVALEYLRSFLMTGFAWYFLAHTQHDVLPLIQVADLGGAYLVSFLVAAVNAIVFEWLYTWPRFRSLLGLKEPEGEFRLRPLVLRIAAVGLLLIGAVGYGLVRLSQEEFTTGPVVALIQSNLDQRVRNDGTGNSAETMISHNGKLMEWAAAQSPLPDLIVWPETSFPGDWYELAWERERLSRDPREGLTKEVRDLLGESDTIARWFALRAKTNVLLGMNSQVLPNPDGKWVRYNSAILLEPGMAVGRYDKLHRVPFGEYVPLRDTFPWMNQFAPYDFDYSILPGQGFPHFPLTVNVEGRDRRFLFGVIICYEDSDPLLARQYVRPTDYPVDFLVNISNDGWFDGTAEHEQHLAICRFRAVECRRAVTRAVNMGVSAFVDGSGRVRRPDLLAEMDVGGKIHLVNQENAPATVPVREWHHFKKTARVLIAAVPIDHRTSLYALWGDWFPVACSVGLLLGLAASFRGRKAEKVN